MKTKSGILSIAACLVVMFSVGIVYLWSVFQKSVIAYYGWDPDYGRIISSVMICLFIFGSMVGGFILDKKSPQFTVRLGGVLFFAGLALTSFVPASFPWYSYIITYSIIAGCGVGFAYTSAINCVQRWFPHRRGFASGITVCAFGLSAVVFAPLSEWLLKLASFGDNAVPYTFRTLAIVFTVLIIAASFFVKTPGADYIASLNLTAKTTGKKQFSPRETVKTPTFWFLALVIFFLPVPFFILNPLVKTIAGFRGLSDATASLTVSLSGIVQAVARLAAGIVSDKIGRAKTVFILGIVSLAATICLMFAGGYFYVIVVWVIYFVYGAPSSIYPAMATDVFGTKHAGGNYGIALMFLGVSSPIFTVISTVISKEGSVTGNFTASFILTAAVGIIPLIALPLYEKTRKKIS